MESVLRGGVYLQEGKGFTRGFQGIRFKIKTSKCCCRGTPYSGWDLNHWTFFSATGSGPPWFFGSDTDKQKDITEVFICWNAF